MLPRFSLRNAFITLTAGALLAVILAAAVRGEVWAIGVVSAVASCVFVLAVHAAFFGFTALVGRLAQPDRPASVEDPHPTAEA